MDYKTFYEFFVQSDTKTRTAITSDLVKRCTELKTVQNQATHERQARKKNTNHSLIPNAVIFTPPTSGVLTTAQRKIVSFDVEKVESKSVDHRGKHSMLAAWVSVFEEANGLFREIYNKKVNQTDVDWNKRQWSGITFQMVKGGITPGQLKEDLLKIFQDKTLVTLEGKNDLISCGFTRGTIVDQHVLGSTTSSILNKRCLGITSPFLYPGRSGTFAPWHDEDWLIMSYFHILEGDVNSSKVWFGLPDHQREAFDKLIAKYHKRVVPFFSTQKPID